METLLIALGDSFWILTYFEVIRRGFKDKRYGIPMAALLINFSWEFIYSFVYPPDNIQLYMSYLWLTLDAVIFYQFLKYWKNDFENIDPRIFYPFVFLMLILAYLLVIVFAKEYGILMGCFYVSYANNLLMSILFISMLYRRKSLAGQSISIALFKLLGTLLASLGYYKFDHKITNSLLLKYFFVTILIFDSIYFICVYLQTKKHLLFRAQETA